MMNELESTEGTRVTVSNETAERLLAQGWRRVDATQPEPQKPARTRKAKAD
ncbi:hypothetical protein ACFWHR_03905 [Leucobacter sp. NPDC058333]|uniref:DUF7302 family protein n=1 Tax=Leucobacter sp. NPDC058333 TaxID=3346450 RepID=UPI0036503D0D